MRSFECSSNQRARAPSPLEQKQTCWVVPVQLWQWQSWSAYVLSSTFSCSRGEMLCAAVTLTAPFLTLCILSDHLSETLWLSGRGVTSWQFPKETVAPFISTFQIQFPQLQMQDVMRDGSCLNEREWRFHWLHRGQNFTLGDLLVEMGRNFHFHREFATLNCVEISNIFFTGQSSYLISDECSGRASSAARKPLEVT